MISLHLGRTSEHSVVLRGTAAVCVRVCVVCVCLCLCLCLRSRRGSGIKRFPGIMHHPDIFIPLTCSQTPAASLSSQRRRGRMVSHNKLGGQGNRAADWFIHHGRNRSCQQRLLRRPISRRRHRRRRRPADRPVEALHQTQV